MLTSPYFGQGNTYTKNFIAESLFKLAQKEEESKELCAQVEASGIIVTVMFHNMAQNDQQRLIDQVKGMLYEVKPNVSIPDDDAGLLRDYVEKLLRYSRQQKVNPFNSCYRVVTVGTYSRFAFIF